MSEDHQIAIIQVDAFMEQAIQLADVLGRVPTTEIVEVLSSAWAQEVGWKTITEGTAYHLQLAENVGMEFQVGEDGAVRLVRRASDRVEETLRGERTEELERLLVEIQPAYNLAFNDVIGRALILALPRQAAELGYQIVEQQEAFEEETHVYDLELKMYVYENV
jgi:hypothetical protein